MLLLADKGRITPELLKDFCFLLMDFVDCDLVNIAYLTQQKLFHCDARKDDLPRFICESFSGEEASLEHMVKKLLCREAGEDTVHSLIHTLTASPPLTVLDSLVIYPSHDKESSAIPWRTLFILLLPVIKGCRGIVKLAFRSSLSPDRLPLDSLREISWTMGLALSYNRTQFQLRERVKELTCMYGIAQEAAVHRQRIETMMERIVPLLPPAFLYPDIAEARILLDGVSAKTIGFTDTVGARLSSSILVDGVKRGEVEVVYRESRPVIDEGPFLEEERRLLDSVAREVSLIVERYQTELEQEQLQEHLRRTDRLATIGQIAAGVAHEINEPLTGILGFAELLKNTDGLPLHARRDVERIESAALHAREVVRKLLLFAKQIPPRHAEVDVSAIIRDVVGFLEYRFVRTSIEVMCHLPREPLYITADESQIRQVVLNLIVNAVQAMPHGGCLTITAVGDGSEVSFSIRDTGIGMSPEVKEKIFVPFFTTKDIHQGTGLGLSVAHGIISAHGGSIAVESEVGKGSCFTVTLPVRRRDAA